MHISTPETLIFNDQMASQKKKKKKLRIRKKGEKQFTNKTLLVDEFKQNTSQ